MVVTRQVARALENDLETGHPLISARSLLMIYRLTLRRLAGLLDPITRDWAIVLGGNLARLALGFLASILIARSLGPGDFGVYAVLAAVVNLTGAFTDLGLTGAAVKRMAAIWPQDPDGVRETGHLLFWLRIGAASFIITIAIVAASLLSLSILAVPQALLQLALLGVVATSISGALSALFQATGHFGRVIVISLTNAGLTTLLAAFLFWTERLTLVTALVVLGIGTSLASFAMGYYLLPRPRRLRIPSLRALQSEGLSLFKFGRWLWLAALFAMLTAQLDMLLVNHWAFPATVGAYALALNLATKVDIVNHSLYTVLLPAASALDGKGAVKRYVRQGLIRGVFISLPLLCLIPLARPFIPFFYGPAYAPAIGLFQQLLGVVLLDVFTTPLLLLAFPFNRPKLMAMAEALRAATLALIAISLIPTIGPSGAIIAKFAAKVVGAALILAVLMRQSGYNKS
jgi:O-antigen/teichoic acid export membrane protein